MPAGRSRKGLTSERTERRRIIAADATVIIPGIGGETGQFDRVPVFAADVLEGTRGYLVQGCLRKTITDFCERGVVRMPADIHRNGRRGLQIGVYLGLERNGMKLNQACKHEEKSDGFFHV